MDFFPIRAGLGKIYHGNLRGQQYYTNFIIMQEVFLRQVYKWLVDASKPNTAVIDVGAYIGDTPIYFSQFKNVAKVFAFETDARRFAMALRNIEKSPYREKIELSDKRLDGASLGRLISSALRSFNHVVIKADCEGCEHTLFNSVPNLSKVDAIMLEWHKGYDDMKKGLEGHGFRVRAEKGIRTGYLYAYRKKNK